jgi:hypothetical protein
VPTDSNRTRQDERPQINRQNKPDVAASNNDESNQARKKPHHKHGKPNRGPKNEGNGNEQKPENQ